MSTLLKMNSRKINSAVRVVKSLAASISLLVFCLFVAASPAPAQENVLRLATPYPLTRLDPLALNDPLQRIVLETCARGLSARTPDDGIAPVAATSLVRSPDFARWRYTLSEDLEYPNGRRLGPSDLEQIFAEYRQAARQSAATEVPFVTALLNISEMETFDEERAIEFILRTPDTSFAETAGSLPLFDIHLRRAFGNHFGIGTQISWIGPYEVAENRDRKALVFSVSKAAIEKGFRGPRRISFRYHSSSEHVLNKLRYGGLDIIPLPSSDQLRRAQGDTSLIVLPSPLVRLAKISGAWRLPVEYWGPIKSPEHRLRTDYIIVRASLSFSAEARSRFDLSTLELNAGTSD